MNKKPCESLATWHDAGRMMGNRRKRRAAEAQLKWIGRAAIGLAMSFLAVLFIFSKGIPGFSNIMSQSKSISTQKEQTQTAMQA